MPAPRPHSCLHPALEQLLEVLGDLENMVSALDDAAYSSSEPLAHRSSIEAVPFPETSSGTHSCRNASSIGAHVRHLLDHVGAILNANRLVDYSQRRRGTPVERFRGAALDEIRKLKRRVSLGLPLFGCDDIEVIDATGPARHIRQHRYRSTWWRELHFVVSHSVHHLAIIRLLAEHTGATVDGQVGVAASTRALDQRYPAQSGIPASPGMNRRKCAP